MLLLIIHELFYNFGLQGRRGRGHGGYKLREEHVKETIVIGHF